MLRSDRMRFPFTTLPSGAKAACEALARAGLVVAVDQTTLRDPQGYLEAGRRLGPLGAQITRATVDADSVEFEIAGSTWRALADEDHDHPTVAPLLRAVDAWARQAGKPERAFSVTDEDVDWDVDVFCGLFAADEAQAVKAAGVRLAEHSSEKRFVALGPGDE